MFGKYFYNESMRRMTVAFGQLFNKIQVKRTDSSGNVVQTLAVPLAYAPKEKFLTRLDQQPNLEEREFSITLPRMSFEISGISYDGARKLTRIQKYKTVKTDKEGKVMNYNCTPVPYNISYTLNIFTATAESGLQIVEQILPFFQPDYTVTVNAVPELDIKRDVPIILNDVQYDDSYNGDYTSRRAVIYTQIHQFQQEKKELQLLQTQQALTQMMILDLQQQLQRLMTQKTIIHLLIQMNK